MKYLCLIAITLSFASPCVHAADTTYGISGQLDDGGSFDGTFTIAMNAVDQRAPSGLGLFDLVDVNVRLLDTDLFGNLDTSGQAITGVIAQDEKNQQQTLVFDFLSDTPFDAGPNAGLFAGAFATIEFGAFTGDADVSRLLLLDGFTSGNFDGAGQSQIVALEVSVIPEPSSAGLLLLLAPLYCCRRFRNTQPLSD